MESGAYELEVHGDSIIFITKPAGYMTPQDAYRLPRFYYVHRPQGSPGGLRYLGIDPTGPLPERIDFPLHQQLEPTSFEAILLADTQPQTEAELDYIRDGVVSELIGTEAAFGMTMGDVLFDDLSMFPRFNSIIAALGVPWYNVAGNHELNLFATSDDYSLETFSKLVRPALLRIRIRRHRFCGSRQRPLQAARRPRRPIRVPMAATTARLASSNSPG